MKRLLVTCLLLAGCGGANGVHVDFAPRALTPSDAAPVGMEVITLSDPRAAFAADHYDATLGSSPVTLRRVSPTELALLVPADASGALSLALSADGFAYPPVALTVGAAPAPPPNGSGVNPAITAALDVADTAIATERQATTDASTLAALDVAAQNLQAARASAASLSATEQTTLAQLIVANPALFSDAVPQDSYQNTGRLIFDIIRFGLAIGFAVTTVGVLTPIGSGLVIAVAFNRLVPQIIAELRAFLTQNVVITGVDDSSLQDLTTLSFCSGQMRQVQLKVTGHALSTDDAGNSSLLATLVERIEWFRGALASANALLAHPYDALPPLGPAQPMSAALDPRYLKLDPTSLSPSQATLIGFQAGSTSLQIGFMGDVGARFSFDVVYDDGVAAPVRGSFAGLFGDGPQCKDPCCAIDGTGAHDHGTYKDVGVLINTATQGFQGWPTPQNICCDKLDTANNIGRVGGGCIPVGAMDLCTGSSVMICAFYGTTSTGELDTCAGPSP